MTVLRTLILASLAASVAQVSATPASVPTASGRCWDLMIPVSVNGRNAKFNLSTPKDDYDVTTASELYITRSINLTDYALTGYLDIKATYTVSARYCSPPKPNGVLLYLTHGLGFDKTYWDVRLENGRYSFVDPAHARGYSTFAIDRVTTGKSSKPDPLKEAQFATELAVNIALTKMLRSNSVKGLPSSFHSTAKKLVHVGHSFGSQLANGLAQMQPALADAIVLTGYSTNASFLKISTAGLALRIANTNQPSRFGSKGSEGYRPNGYLTWVDKWQNMLSFFAAPYFSRAVLDNAEKTKMPAAVGELLTLGAGSPLAPEYKGPVMVITGDKDALYCGSDCRGILEKVGANFPKAKTFKSVRWPKTGHALNLHYNSKGAYSAIFDFLGSQGL